MQPTVAIIFAEITVVLLLSLAVFAYLAYKKNRLQRAELNTLIGLARHADFLPSANPPPVTVFFPVSADEYPQPPSPSYGHDEGALSQAGVMSFDNEFAERTNLGISEIRQALVNLDAKLEQLRQENHLIGDEFKHKIGEEAAQTLQIREELQEVSDIVAQIRSQYESLQRDFTDFRDETTASLARQEARSDAAVITGAPQLSSTAGHKAHQVLMEEPDLSLPDDLLEQIEPPAKAREASPLPQSGSPSTAKPSKDASNDPARSPTRGKRQNRSVSSLAHSNKLSAGNGKGDPVHEPQFAFNTPRGDEATSASSFMSDAANAGINVEEIVLDESNNYTRKGIWESESTATVFDSERVFYQASTSSGVKPGWYFSMRGGKTHGPFSTKDTGERVLNEMIEHFKQSGDSGGR